ILFVLQDKVNVPVGRRRTYPLRKLLEQVLWAVVENCVDCIEPQAVEVKLLDPIKRVMDNKLAHWAAIEPVEIDRGTPRRSVALCKSLRRDGVDIGTFGAEVVVHDVEQHHKAAAVGGLDERLQ